MKQLEKLKQERMKVERSATIQRDTMVRANAIIDKDANIDINCSPNVFVFSSALVESEQSRDFLSQFLSKSGLGLPAQDDSIRVQSFVVLTHESIYHPLKWRPLSLRKGLSVICAKVIVATRAARLQQPQDVTCSIVVFSD